MLRFLQKTLGAFIADRRGNVAIITCLALPAIIGAFGVGAEGASWYASRRAMQNAADAAAIAAATNASANYDVEARAVATQYGFQHGVDGVTVTAVDNAPCPSGGSTCYGVTISRATPLLLAQVVGYRGDATVAGSPAQLISATAVAIQGATPRPYCVLALGTSGVTTALTTNGAPKADLSGCNVMSNTGETCNGHNLGADVGDAHGVNNGCGVVQHSNLPILPDPYAGLAGNIPADPCNGKYPQIPGKNGVALPAGNTPAGAVSWSGVQTFCGDVQLSGDVTVNHDTTLVIYNGQLDTNGLRLLGASGVGMTVIFAGSNSGYVHAPTGGGALDFAAPTSGPWQGIALYQAPNLTSGVDISAAGNSPTWNLTGIAYFPHATVTFSGAVNKSSNGKSCFGMVVNSMVINGTGSILSRGECGQAGVTLPTGQVPGRGKLVS